MPAELPTPRDDQDRKLLANVRDDGWHIVMIPEDAETPGWCFTVGLEHTFGHPELVVFGLPLNTAHALLTIGCTAIRNGERFEPDVACPQFLAEFACVFRSVRRQWHGAFLGYAAWFNGVSAWTALQLFWPDRSGKLPWQDGAAEWLGKQQPLLHEDDAAQAGLTALLASMETT